MGEGPTKMYDPQRFGRKISKQSRRITTEEHQLQIFPEQLLEFLRMCGEDVPETTDQATFVVKHRKGTVEFGETGTYVCVSFKREHEEIG